jgi:hypothetical protein
MSYGDVGNESAWVPHGGLISIQMPTAIARYYGPEGFAIAADGLKSNLREPSQSTADNQKVFKIEGRKLAYSVAGIVELSQDDESEEIVVKLLPALAESILSQGKRPSKTLLAYAKNIAMPVNRKLAELKRAGTIRRYPIRTSPMRERGHTILRVYFDGYYGGIESRASVRFSHEDQRLSSPEVERQSVSPGGPITFGSVLISELLFMAEHKQDSRLAQFRKNWNTATLAGAVEICQAYIAACSSSEGRELDNEVCSRIGGNPQIATITPSGGFQWVEGFKPKGVK